MARKLALIIGNSRYNDPGLARLATADVDVREFAGVLRTPEIGQFDEVVELPDEGLAVVRRSIAQFFTKAKRDDLLVFYFSGHGIKDENGHLYLAVKDTEPHLLAGTSIEAAFITAQMDRSYSKRQVLILDCCHSGAFAYGTKAADAQVVGTAPAFEGTGYGRVVLTATDSTQYAWQGDQIIGESDKSVFTHYLLEGLKTGEADRDGDGLITIDELYDYVYEHVVSETPKQTPGKWSYKQQGDIVVARNPQPLVRAAELPLEVRALIDSPLSRLRAEAVPELAVLLKGRHRGLALAARRALEDLRTDDSRRVSAAAEAVLATLLQEDEAAAAAAQEAERVKREAGQLVAEAAEQLIGQDLPGALAKVDAARELDPSNAEAVSLRDEIQQAIDEAHRREELEREAHARRERVAALIARADQAATHQAAIEALSEALVLDPGHEPARQLLARHNAALEHIAAEQARQQELAAARRTIEDLLQREELSEAEQVLVQAEKSGGDLSAFEDVRRRLRHKQRDRLAAGLVEGARREFAAGRHDSALASLERFRPPHPLVSRALADLTSDLERLRRQEEERRQRDAERLARAREVVSLLDVARSQIEQKQFVEALGSLGRLRQLDQEVAGVADLVETAEAGRVAAEDAARRRREAEGKLANALKRFRKRDFAPALALAEEACRLDPENSAVSGMRDEIRQALNERVATASAAGPSHQAQVPPRTAQSLVRRLRPLHVGLASIVVLVAGVILFILLGREAPSESANRPSMPAAPVQLAPTTAAAAPASIRAEGGTPPDSSSVPAQAQIVPPADPSPVPAPSNVARGVTGRAITAATDKPRAAPGSNKPPVAPAAAVPSETELRIARLLADGDKLIEARNYDGASSAYEEAGRLGSAVGRERAEKAAQEKAAQVRLRLSRAERLQDTGDYVDALRTIDEALVLDPKSVDARRLRQRVLDAQKFELGLRPGRE